MVYWAIVHVYNFREKGSWYTLYMIIIALFPANQQVDISVWNLNIMNRAHQKFWGGGTNIFRPWPNEIFAGDLHSSFGTLNQSVHEQSGISLGWVLIGGTYASGIPQNQEFGCFDPWIAQMDENNQILDFKECH